MALKKEGLIMQDILNATHVRKNWGSFIDNVVRFKPSVIKRNRDLMAAISLEQLDMILDPYRFTLTYEKENNNSLTGHFKELDLVANAPDLNSLLTTMIQELIEYAEEYMKDFEQYYNSLNRKQHFPYVMRVMKSKGRGRD